MKNVIETLYFKLIETEEYAKADAEIHENFDHILYEKVIEPLHNTDVDIAEEVENAFINSCTAREQYFFAQGFKTAIQLKYECDTI